MTEQRTVEFSREIAANPEAIFQALTHPLELSYWFCHAARVEPRRDGEFHVRWRNGWWAHGVYQMVERPRRVELTWQGKDEPGETALVFEIQALDEGSLVKVVHSGYGADAVWDKAVAEAEQSWPLALENLESVLTTGIDLRVANRPMLGIVPDEVTPERAAKEGIAVDLGIYVSLVLEDGGAAEAGLQPGDVIVGVGGMAVYDLDSLMTTLSPYRAGNRVQVTYARGRERHTAIVELKPQRMPEVPFDKREVVEQVRKEQAAGLAALRDVVSRLSEQQADQRPGADAWSVKETLAHLSLSERFTQQWLADVIVGNTPGQVGGNPAAASESIAMTLAAAPTVEALLRRLESDMEETLALFSALRPEIVLMRARYRAMASYLLSDYHIKEHLTQIQAAITALGG